MADTLLDVVNENDEVIGQELRSMIHANGLLHREVIVWFITPKKEIILQRRGKNKPSGAGLLAATVGGHVESGSSYEQTALIETEEETGVVLLKEDLHYLYKYQSKKPHNMVIRFVYGVLFIGSVNNLRIEAEDGDGFEIVSFYDLSNPSAELKELLVSSILELEFPFIRDQLEKLVDNG